MAMSQRSRSALYEGLSGVIAEPQAVEEMLAYFPSRQVEEPVTKEFLRAEMADLHTEIVDLHTEMADLRGELRAGLADVRGELRAGLADVRAEFTAEMGSLRTDMEAKFNRLLFQLLASMAAFVSLVMALSGLT